MKLHRRIRIVICMSLLLAFAACQPGLPPPASEPTSTLATPTALPPPPASTNPLEQDFQLYADEPVLPMGQAGTWNSGLMDPGAVVYQDGLFHMFYNAVPHFPSELASGYATSPDGLTWTHVVTEPVFTLDNIHWSNRPQNIHVDCVLVEGNRWIMYFSASSSVSELTGVVGRATATSPRGPWTVDPEPVLLPGEQGTWDAGIVGLVQVVRMPDSYVMYYSGYGGIGRATAEDGVHWTKYNDPATSEALFALSDPVIADTSSAGQQDPNILQTSQGWEMTYRSARGVEYVVSPDGIDWTQAAKTPLISSQELQKTIWFTAFLIQDGTSYLFFEAGENTTRTYLATWKN